MTYERVVLTDKLTVVLGFCELLLQNAYGQMDERQRSVLEGMVQAARGARDIVRSSPSDFVAD